MAYRQRDEGGGETVGVCRGCGSVIVPEMGYVIVAGGDDDGDEELLCEDCVGTDCDDEEEYLEPLDYPDEDGPDPDWGDEPY